MNGSRPPARLKQHVCVSGSRRRWSGRGASAVQSTIKACFVCWVVNEADGASGRGRMKFVDPETMKGHTN